MSYQHPEPHPNRWRNWWLNMGNQGAIKTDQQVSDEFWHPSRPTVSGRIIRWFNHNILCHPIAGYQPEGLPLVVPPAGQSAAGGGLANMPQEPENFISTRNDLQPPPSPEEEIRFILPNRAAEFVSPSDANVTHAETGADNIIFHLRGRSEFLKLCGNGDIWVKGVLIENDKELVTGLREFFDGTRLRLMNHSCSKCGHVEHKLG